MKMLWNQANRRNMAPSIVNRPPIIYPTDKNGEVLLPYFTLILLFLLRGTGPLSSPPPDPPPVNNKIIMIILQVEL